MPDSGKQRATLRCPINSNVEAAIAMRFLIPLLVAVSLALPVAAEPPVELDSEDEKIIYSR